MKYLTYDHRLVNLDKFDEIKVIEKNVETIDSIGARTSVRGFSVVAANAKSLENALGQASLDDSIGDETIIMLSDGFKSKIEANNLVAFLFQAEQAGMKSVSFGAFTKELEKIRAEQNAKAVAV